MQLKQNNSPATSNWREQQRNTMVNLYLIKYINYDDNYININYYSSLD